jgi:hypothetical protein
MSKPIEPQALTIKLRSASSRSNTNRRAKGSAAPDVSRMVEDGVEKLQAEAVRNHGAE